MTTLARKLKVLKVVCPWAIEVPRKTKANKKYAMSLNTYRNLDFRVNNMLKKMFKQIVLPQLEGKVLQTPVTVTMQAFKPSRRIVDKGNLYGMAHKYLYDAMTEFGCWEDDNDKFIHDELIKPTIYDKDKGRIEFTFTTIKEGK